MTDNTKVPVAQALAAGKKQDKREEKRIRDTDDTRVWTVIGIPGCPWLEKTKALLDEVGQPYVVNNINAMWQRRLLLDYHTKRTPAIFAGSQLLGSYTDIVNYFSCSFFSDKELFL